MCVDCHIHMVLDGDNWKAAIARHEHGAEEAWVRKTLRTYQEKGFTYLRDGGDRWGVNALAKRLAPEYGITYRTPLANLCKKGHYGGFIGQLFGDMNEYAQAVRAHKAAGADFIKIMISGIMDFDQYGVLSEKGLEPKEIKEMIHIAHEEGMAVMAHANGSRVVEAAAEGGIDSVEHGAYLHHDVLCAMAEMGCVWVPTLSTLGNVIGKGRFQDEAVKKILTSAMLNVKAFADMGGMLAPGTDAGAWMVHHGDLSEYQWLRQALGQDPEPYLQKGIRTIQEKF